FPDGCSFCGVSAGGIYAFSLKGREGRIYNLWTGKVIGKIQGDADFVSGTFNADGTRLITRDSFNRLLLWDTSRGERIAAFGVADSDKWRFSPNGHHVLTWRHDDSGTLWSAKTGALSQSFAPGALESFSFSDRDSWLVTKAQDSSITLWNTDTNLK